MGARGFFRIRERAELWLIIALALNAMISVASGFLVTGESADAGLRGTAPWFSQHILRSNRNLDSWRTMRPAYHRNAVDPERGMYSIFFEDKVKFQYPPPSLLILDLFPEKLLEKEGEPEFSRIVSRISQLATLASILISVLTLEIGLRRNRLAKSALGWTALRVMLACMLGLTFYPLIKGHELGQIQVHLNMLVSVAVLSQVLDRPAVSGVCIGLCSLVKPQFGAVLLWGLLRRHTRFTVGMLSAIGVGLTISLIRFGWHNHIEYLAVLHTIGRHGETFWPNQSINGLMNRFLLNGDPVRFTEHAYAPFNMTVYAATLASSLVMLTVAFCSRRRPPGSTHPLIDFMTILVVVTMASPVAWEHHYGILVPVCAALLPILLRSAPCGRWTGLLFAGGFAAAANVLLRPHLIFADRWSGLAGSHLFFGSIIIFILLLAARRDAAMPRSEK